MELSGRSFPYNGIRGSVGSWCRRTFDIHEDFNRKESMQKKLAQNSAAYLL